MANIFELVNSNAMAAYYNTVAGEHVAPLGAALFPSKKKLGLKLEWIKGYNELPVVLAPSAFDAKPQLRDRGEISLETTRMPFFRESMRLGEQERQELLMFQEANHNEYAMTAVNKIFDDVTTLVKGAQVNPEIMRMGLLTKGTFTIASDSVTYEYNYDQTGTWAGTNTTTLTGTDAWSDTTNSNPIQDIMTIKRKAESYGVTLTKAIVGATTWGYLVQNKNIIGAIYPLGNTVNLTDAQVVDYLYNATGIRFSVYAKMYKDSNKTSQYYYPQDKQCTFISDVQLGSTWYGTTPEEADLMSGVAGVDVSVVDTGVAILVKKESLPVNIITSVSEIVLPSFEGMSEVYNITW